VSFLKRIYLFLKKLAILRRKTTKKYYSLFNFNFNSRRLTKQFKNVGRDKLNKGYSKLWLLKYQGWFVFVYFINDIA
jgi:hypothetical protein